VEDHLDRLQTAVRSLLETNSCKAITRPLGEPLRNEVEEFIEALREGTLEAALDELGDVLFGAVMAGMIAGLDPRDAIDAVCEKTAARVRTASELAAMDGLRWPDLRSPQADAYWSRAKDCSVSVVFPAWRPEVEIVLPRKAIPGSLARDLRVERRFYTMVAGWRTPDGDRE
jgi:hypothetical protein